MLLLEPSGLLRNKPDERPINGAEADEGDVYGLGLAARHKNTQTLRFVTSHEVSRRLYPLARMDNPFPTRSS
jgi:hypothetical protein